MLANNQAAGGEFRHNYVRIGFLVGACVLFACYIAANQIFERGSMFVSTNGTLRPEDAAYNDVVPSDWVYRSLNALNYLWQLSWLLYSLTFIYRRSSIGYLYVAPNTLTPIFYLIYMAGFIIPSVWLIWFQKTYLVWTWIPYLVAFLLLSWALFIINNNLALNKKIYETDGFNRDIWFLRFFAQNGVAFFACWTAVRFVLAFDTFLQLYLGLSLNNSGTIVLILAGLIAAGFFFVSNFNAALVEKCAYQFAPWIVFIFYFWGVVENNWIPKHPNRNNIIAAVELLASLVAAVFALALFTMRFRVSKVDPIA